MNERIKELMAQAMISTGVEGLGGEYRELNPEKFAELIVKQCAEFARQHNLRHADRSHMIHKAIEQHFGVE
jgi:hypothetical protein